MKKLTKKETLKKQTTFKHILLIIGMIFLILAYGTYMECNFKLLDKNIGLIVAIAVLPLTVELINMYLKAKENKDESSISIYKTYINIVVPVVSFLFTRYFYYYASSLILDFKINALIAIVPSIIMAVFTKSIIGMGMIQILNIGILASCTYGTSYIYPIISILIIISSLMYFIYNMNIDLDKKSKSSPKVKEVERKDIIKNIDIFKDNCIRVMLSISIILLIYGLIKAVFNNINLFNISSILLLCGIINIDFIKNKFKSFPYIYSLVYQVALVFLITIQICSNNIDSINAITIYVNPIILLLSAHLLIGCAREYKENLEIFTLQILVVVTPILMCFTPFIATVIVVFALTFLLIQAFRKGKDEKYLIYLMPLIFAPIVNIYLTKSASNLEVLEYLIISIMYFITYLCIKKATKQK